MTEATRRDQSSGERTLFVAFELSAATWRLAMTTERGETPRHYAVPARDLGTVFSKLSQARRAWGLSPETPVVSCYEAGRDGFWLDRALRAQGIGNVVVDPASIERDRRAKHVKTDRVDAGGLLGVLVRWALHHQHLRIVRVPSEAEEDARHRERELLTVKAARVASRHRITGLLATQGVRVRVTARLDVEAIRDWAGRPLGAGLRARLGRELDAFHQATARLTALRAERDAAIQAGASRAAQQMQQLLRLRAIGRESVGRFVTEFFAWRPFQNGRQVGALAGLTPTPAQSGQQAREQGISKAGNWRIRTLAIEVAWGWLRFQPTSALSVWYQTRFGRGSGRLRRIGIVALARKLLIALWRFLEYGELPEGAALKA